MTAICTSPIAIERMEDWTKSDDEWIEEQAGLY